MNPVGSQKANENCVQRQNLKVGPGMMNGSPITCEGNHSPGEEMGRRDTNSLCSFEVTRPRGATSGPVGEDFLSLRNPGLWVGFSHWAGFGVSLLGRGCVLRVEKMAVAMLVARMQERSLDASIRTPFPFLQQQWSTSLSQGSTELNSHQWTASRCGMSHIQVWEYQRCMLTLFSSSWHVAWYALAQLWPQGWGSAQHGGETRQRERVGQEKAMAPWKGKTIRDRLQIRDYQGLGGEWGRREGRNWPPKSVRELFGVVGICDILTVMVVTQLNLSIVIELVA